MVKVIEGEGHEAYVKSFDEMAMKQPAFPMGIVTKGPDGQQDVRAVFGLTKREWMAGMIAQGLSSFLLPEGHPLRGERDAVWDHAIAIIAVRRADALLAELARTEPKASTNPPGSCL